MSLRFCLAPFYLALLSAGPSVALGVQFADGGIVFDAGTMGKFTLSWPELEVGEQKLKPVEKNLAGRQAVLKYAGGTQVTLSLATEGSLTLAFANAPAGLTRWRMDMGLDFGLSEGGTWRIGEGQPKPFPAEKPATPFLYQGNATALAITDNQNQMLSFRIPDWSYIQLQDNREWNWKIFWWWFSSPFDRNNPRATVAFAQGKSGDAPAGPIVDRFGQDARQEFPGKIKSEAELKSDVETEQAYYASLPAPATDIYGGEPGSRQKYGLQQTGFFHVQRVNNRWLLVDPEGNAVFHLGLCGFQPSDDFTYIKGREQVYEWLPSYDGEYRTAFHTDNYWSRDTLSFYLCNVIRKFGQPYDKEVWAARMIDRVRRLGFNATGAFSSVTRAHREKKFPWPSSLPLGEWDLGHQVPGLRGLIDPFDEATAKKMDELFGQRLPGQANEPLLIGYFLGNEQAFEDIPRVVPTLPEKHAAKRQLVAFLRDKYGDVAAFNTAWNLALASWDEAPPSGLAVTTKAAAADMQAYSEVFIDAYYKLIHDTFRKYDRNHLLIGNRWMPSTANNETLCRVAGKYLDVLSVNYYTYAVDTAFLKRLSDWAGGKPLLLSEFYWACPAESGLPGGSEVKTQTERGLAYRNYVEQAAATGFVVGVQWFTLIDQARTGRFFERYTGERANSGIFSVADRPYKDFLAEATRTNYNIYQVLSGEQPPFRYDHPRFSGTGPSQKTVKIPRAPGRIVLDGQRDDWPGVPAELIPASRVVQGVEAGVEAAFWLCWDDTNLYLMAQVTDPTPMLNDQTGPNLWNADGLELFLGHEELERGGAMLFTDRQVLLGAGRSGAEARWHYVNAPRQGPAALIVVPAVDGRGYVVEAALPFAELGFTPTDGRQILFDLAVDDGSAPTARQRQLMWNGTARNSSDRTNWGRAVFLK